MNSALVIIPTYNEIDTLPVVIESVLKYEGFDVLVVDDGSPDGTAQIVKDLMAANSRISLIERSGKLGLGTAYVTGFKWGLEKGYDYFIEMDADGSHDPAELSSFIDEIKRGCGLVIGSRYLNGLISGGGISDVSCPKFGNYYASRTLGLKLTDLTSGFRCYSRKALESIDLEKVHSNGYAFQIEMAYRVSAAGHRLGEMSIIFSERASGASKMSKKIVREAVMLPWRLRLGRLFASGQGMVRDSSYQVRTAAGLLLIAAGLAGGVCLGWWLSTEGDIVEIIHRAKMGLPDWAGMVMKVGLSASAALFIVLFLEWPSRFLRGEEVKMRRAEI
jgi:dolichol-phosphate mannosyltransferase